MTSKEKARLYKQFAGIYNSLNNNEVSLKYVMTKLQEIQSSHKAATTIGGKFMGIGRNDGFAFISQ